VTRCFLPSYLASTPSPSLPPSLTPVTQTNVDVLLDLIFLQDQLTESISLKEKTEKKGEKHHILTS
jgi:hypothetical protein